MFYSNDVPEIEDSYGNGYCCDGCGEYIPEWEDVNWFTSSVGFCDDCDYILHCKVPQVVLDFCCDICEGSGADADDTAEFICGIAGSGRI